MPRQSRITGDDVCYHVISRRNEKQVAFKNEGDYEKFLDILLKYKRKYRFRLYGWCPFYNHAHLVIDTPLLSKAMQGVNLSYVLYFKKRYKQIGHFWQDRFKSIPIQRDQYLINVISYIENNPVRAGIVARPEDWKWSSYRARVLGKNSELLDPVEW